MIVRIENEMPSNTGDRKRDEEEPHKQTRTQRLRYIERERGILCPRDWLFPVTSIVTGHDPVRLHESFGMSANGKTSDLTARYWGTGTCNRGGHCGGFGMAHVATWSSVEYCKPQTFSNVPSPFVSISTQPHVLLALFNSLSSKSWVITSRMQRTKGKRMSRQFVLIFRFWGAQK